LEEEEAPKKPFFSEEKEERRGGKKRQKNINLSLILNPNVNVREERAHILLPHYDL